MKKADLITLLQEGKKDPAKLQKAIDAMSATRGMQFEIADEVKGMSDKFWYTVQEGKAVKVSKTKTRNDGRKAEFVPYYRTIA